MITVMNNGLRDTWDENTLTFKRDVYIKTRKEWKPILEFPVQGTPISISNTGKRHIMWKYYNDVRYVWSEKNEAENACLDALMKEIPAAKFWIKKLEEIGFPNLYCLSILMGHKDIPETESLIMKLGQYRIALTLIQNTAWRRLKPSQRKQVINNLRDWQGMDEPWCIKDALTGNSIKNSLVRIGYGNTRITQRDIEWLGKHPVDGMSLEQLAREFHDYLLEQENLVPDITDTYWRHRKDWRKEHQKEQKRREWHRRVNGLRIFLGLPERSYERINTVAFKNRYSKLTDMVLQEGELKAYFSDNIKEWERHATALRQCLMSCKYYNRESCRILFITRNGRPEATAEILKDNTIGQFMGDERSQLTIMPKNDVKELLTKFLRTYRVM